MATPATARSAPSQSTIPADIRRLRAERYADTDLASALRYGIRGHSIDAHDGEQRRDSTEDHEQRQLEPGLRDRIGKHLIHGLNMRERLIRIHAMNSGLNGAADPVGIAGRAYHELREIHRGLKVVDEDRGLRRFL